MSSLPTLKVGNALAIPRRALLLRLEGASSNPSKSSVKGSSSHNPTPPASQKIPSGIHLCGCELRIRFTSADDLAAKLSVISEKLTTDWDAFAAQIRTGAPAQQKFPAVQQPAVSAQPEPELKRSYYPKRWERWSK